MRKGIAAACLGGGSGSSIERCWKVGGSSSCFRHGCRRCSFGAGAGGEEAVTAELKACSDLECGKSIHARMVESGHGFPLHVTNALLDMYVKCGSMVDARHVFEHMLLRNVVSWNVLISGYVKKEEGELALGCYAKMQQEGVTPNAQTFVGAIKACSSLARLEEGRESDGKVVKVMCLKKGKAIHCRLVKCGFGCDAYIGNTLIDMYAKCGSMGDARRVFDDLSHRNVVSWSVMILGYAQMEEGEVALELFAQMQQRGVAPNDRTFVGALKACSSLGTREEGRETRQLWRGRSIHCQVVKSGLEWNVFVGTMLVDMYVKCGSMVDARHVFEKLPHRNVVSWTAMILGYAQNGEGEVALELYSRMQQEGVAPNDRTFVAALKSCAVLASVEEWTQVDGEVVKWGCLEKGRAVHSRILKSMSQVNVFVGTMLVDMYAKCGSMVDAHLVFEKLPHRNVFSWNVMILGYVDRGNGEAALELFAQMREQGLSPNSVTFVSILKGCGNAAMLDAGRQIHAQIRQAGLETSDTMVATALVDMYGKCGSMGDAQHVLDALGSRNLVTWSALMGGYARQGDAARVFDCFHRMRQQGIQANAVTFLTLLTACSHAGLVGKGQQYFDAMRKEYGITPTIQHYTCMVDILGRAGQLDEAMAMVTEMPVQPNLATWMTLLAACRKWTNVDIARQAFKRAVELDEKHSAAYVLMSNIFADAHMWEEHDMIKARREDAGARKQQPGKSWWTEKLGVVHSFVAGDAKHPQRRHIYSNLKHLFFQMEEEVVTMCSANK